MKLELFFAILFILMVLQILGARLQVRQYQAAVRRLRQRGNVGIGGRKGRFGPGCIVLLACSGDGTIVGAISRGVFEKKIRTRGFRRIN